MSGKLLAAFRNQEVQGSEETSANDLSFPQHQSEWFPEEYLETSGKALCLPIARIYKLIHSSWVNDNFYFSVFFLLCPKSHGVFRISGTYTISLMAKQFGKSSFQACKPYNMEYRAGLEGRLILWNWNIA